MKNIFNNIIIAKLLVLYIVVSLFTYITLSPSVNAKPIVGFNSGRIIDDFVFTNHKSMTIDQIQEFLNSKVPVCDTSGELPASDFGRPDLTHAQYASAKGWPTPPYACLKDYSENNLSSAQIIFNLSRHYEINPQILIVLLQKEQGLVTDTWPLPNQYRSATGYGCPDTAPCDSRYYGLTNQLKWSAIMFRSIMNNSPTWYTPYILGKNFIPWNPNSACGGSIINIENRATQALYNYTPYQPNSAALDAGYGSGDSCSSYGNRNFYLYFTDWFGTTRANDTTKSHPDGTLINIANRVYKIEKGELRYIINSAIFESYDYKWHDIKPATTGDSYLTVTDPVDSMSPGSLFMADDSGVYTSVLESGKWVKQLMSYASFVKLGYKWEQVKQIQKQELPALTSKTIYTSSQHPDGTLIKNKSGVFMIDNGEKHYISAAVFNSYQWQWENILPETPKDSKLPVGKDIAIREGSIVSDNNNLYVVQTSITGVTTKNPIGPWECYYNVYKYNINDIIVNSTDITDIKTGPNISC